MTGVSNCDRVDEKKMKLWRRLKYKFHLYLRNGKNDSFFLKLHIRVGRKNKYFILGTL